ncbi:MAG: M3 family oligoendopeptidase [Spirochaetales bacterium]|nr:M3 family oligoendopeptidase [Spirochaetales bacterium]
MSDLPRWDLTAVYPALGSEAYEKDFAEAAGCAGSLGALAGDPPGAAADEPAWIERFIGHYNRYIDLFETLYAFAYMSYSVNTGDYRAIGEMNRLDALKVPVERALVEFRNALAAMNTSLDECLAARPALAAYRFFLDEQLLLRARQMSPAEEELAGELTRMGGEPWGRLQESVSSSLKGVWNETKGTTKTVIELRAFAFDPKRAVRKKAFELELKLWESMRIPLAFSINGVKGFSTVLHQKRRYRDSLEYSLTRARITPAVLEALIGVLSGALPRFRRYFKAKAKMLGVPALAFYDLFAPLSEKAAPFGFEEARGLVLGQFGAFSGELEDFARRAFAARWIDAAPRAGKVGGAYCISLPLRKASRVLCNFSPSFGAAATIAHELGHAFHHQVLKDAPAVHRDYPMTLAETASIFSENLVYEGAIISFPKARKAEALEHFLQDAAQIVVDILSRFLFESRLFAARSKGEVSADELCAMMLDAQRETYGDGLDPDALHPYMWAVKGHYYRPELPFYNYPYAFGLLFGLGLFALFREQGRRFAETYKSVLAKTGRMACVDLTAELGFDIERPAFWEQGMGLIVSRIDEFCRLAEQAEAAKSKARTPGAPRKKTADKRG